MASWDDEFPVREEYPLAPEELPQPEAEAEFRPPDPLGEHSAPPGTDYPQPVQQQELTPPGYITRAEKKMNRRRRIRRLLYGAGALVLTGLLFSETAQREPVPASVIITPSPAPVYTSASDIPLPVVTPEPTPTPTPVPTPTPTPEPELTLDRITGTYNVSGMGVTTGGYVYEGTGMDSQSGSGTIKISSSGEDVLTMTGMMDGSGVEISGEGAYSYDKDSGRASFVDSFGTTDTLIFTEENGQIILEITIFRELPHGTETVTMTGARG